MAELSVQPKKKPNYLAWLLLILGLIFLIWFFTRHKDGEKATANTADSVSATASTKPAAGWDGIDFNAPAMMYDEITDKNITVRGNDKYGIYGLGENILFDEGKATIRPDAEANLKQIATSVNKRYSNGEVRVYGYTDSKGDAASNKELAQQRADAVKAWMQSNGTSADKISVNAIGESQPVATNSTEEGREQNRRVEIVARSGAAQ